MAEHHMKVGFFFLGMFIITLCPTDITIEHGPCVVDFPMKQGDFMRFNNQLGQPTGYTGFGTTGQRGINPEKW